MEKFTLLDVYKYTNGRIIGDCCINSISIDSRKITENCLFVGINGENFDGNDYVNQAIENGACAILSTKKIDGNSVIVTDSNQAFLDLASGYKQQFSSLKTVGVTGSVGKTTTKEMIASVLLEMGNTHKNIGNLNNHIGVPLTLLELENAHEYAVIEMGMNHKGEIALLSNCAKPDVAVISNIGVSHIEFLGSREGIRDAKMEITSGLSGDLILNGDEPLLRDLETKNNIIYFGIDSENLDVTCSDIQSFDDYTTFKVSAFSRQFDIKINSIGKHNIINALSAVAVGISLGATDEQITVGLLKFQNTGMRQNIVKHKNFTVIEDCYNASPDSMKASIDVLTQIDGNKKIAVLGSMGELGEHAVRAHSEVYNYAMKYCNEVFLYGHTWDEIGVIGANVYDDKEKLALDLNKIIGEKHVVLFKGSRALKMEDVLNMVLGEDK